MPRRKRSSSPCDLFDDDFDDDSNSQSSRNGHPPIQRNAANARERARMRVLSSAFGRLKTKLPNIPPDTKLSKLDTLRLATMYIKQLRALAEGSNASSNDAMNSMQFNDQTSLFGQSGAHNLTWPFGLHHIQHATNRQLPFHCSTAMEWSPPLEPVNNARLAEETAYHTHTQNHSHAPQLHAWYTTQNTHLSTQSNCHNNHFDVFNGFNEEAPPLGQSQHTASTHHQQNTMTPIR